MDSFDTLYLHEKRYFRELCRVIAQDNPKLEAFIGHTSSDPDVEKLIEGFSVLSAGVRRKIEDAFPELTQNMLSRIWSFPLRSIPSTCIIQLLPKKNHLTVDDDIAAGAVVASNNGIEFKTCRDLHIAPLILLSKKLSVGNDNSLIELKFRYNGGTKNWHPGPFQLYLGNDQKVAAELRLWLDQYQLKNYIFYKEHRIRVYQNIVFLHDYCAKNLTIPADKGNYWSAQLLPEYYYLPHVDDFISIDLSHEFPVLALPQDGIFSLQLVFEGLIPLTQQDIEQSFILNCVPVINLKQKSTANIGFHADRDRYDIPVNQVQIFKILSVYSSQEPENEKQGERFVFTPITERNRRNKFEDLNAVYYEVVIYRDAFDSVKHQIRFYDAALQPLTQSPYVNFACDYLALHNQAETLPVGEINIPGIDITSSWSVQNITPATPSYPAITNSHVHWRLLNQLSFNPVWLNNLQAVKETVSQFNLHSDINVPFARQLQQQIKGLSAIRCQPVDRLFSGQMRRGYQLDLVIDESHFTSQGAAYVFIGVLVHFFSFTITENCFLQTNINVYGTNKVWYLPEVFGHRKVM